MTERPLDVPQAAPEVAATVISELRACASVHHPNLVKVYGFLHRSDGGTPPLVQEAPPPQQSYNIV